VRNREEVAEVLRRAQHQKHQFTEKLSEQQAWIEAQLAQEIERTNATEAEMRSMKTDFAQHLLQLEGLQKAAAVDQKASADAAAASVTVRLCAFAVATCCAHVGFIPAIIQGEGLPSLLGHLLKFFYLVID
jgi:hypothetical protein